MTKIPRYCCEQALYTRSLPFSGPNRCRPNRLYLWQKTNKIQAYVTYL